MTDFEKDEFWKGLGRLYDETLELRKIAEKDGEHIHGLLRLSEKDGENIQGLALIAKNHARRMATLEGGEKL